MEPDELFMHPNAKVFAVDPNDQDKFIEVVRISAGFAVMQVPGQCSHTETRLENVPMLRFVDKHGQEWIMVPNAELQGTMQAIVDFAEKYME